MLLELGNKRYDRMTEIVITIMILLSALAMRDAIIFELSKCETIKKLSPVKFALLTLAFSALLIWILAVPLKKAIFGETNDVYLFRRGIDFAASVAFLICALSLREASSNFFDESSENSRIPWIWAILVLAATLILILTTVICK